MAFCLSEANKFFSDVPDRTGTSSLKWEKYSSSDVIPLWVADMDFKSPPSVVDLAVEISSRGNFGYGVCPKSLYEIVIQRSSVYYDWSIDKQTIVWLPGMVCGLNIACKVFQQSASQVLTNTPIYPPFLTAPGYSQLKCTRVPMVVVENQYEIDFEKLLSLETKSGDLFMLCHPHNPVGRCFSQDELLRLCNFILERDLFVCSDEIHCDLILEKGLRHIPFASLNSEIADRTITLMAPSKTFNLPGFGCSYAVIPNIKLRNKFRNAMRGIVPDPPAMGFLLAEEAYRNGEKWRIELIKYLRTNRDLAFSEISSLPGITPYSPQATYLMWVDARGLGIENPHSFFEDAGVGLSNGADFGNSGFLRLNLGCTRSLLEKAIERMKTALVHLS